MMYIVTHKPVDIPPLKGFKILGVGGSRELPYERDNTGDNISTKNSTYCELTAMYWIWKNTSDEFKGLCHYRRLFGKSNLSTSWKSALSHRELISLLDSADIVLPYVEHMKQTVKEEILIECCKPDVFEMLRNIVIKSTPDYKEAFDKVFGGNKCTLFNMLFCRREVFDGYCNWLFPILFELEKNVDMTGYSDYQRRLFGFLSERLLSVYVTHNGLRVKNTCVLNLAGGNFQLLRRRFTNEIYFRISHLWKHKK